MEVCVVHDFDRSSGELTFLGVFTSEELAREKLAPDEPGSSWRLEFTTIPVQDE